MNDEQQLSIAELGAISMNIRRKWLRPSLFYWSSAEIPDNLPQLPGRVVQRVFVDELGIMALGALPMLAIFGFQAAKHLTLSTVVLAFWPVLALIVGFIVAVKYIAAISSNAHVSYPARLAWNFALLGGPVALSFVALVRAVIQLLDNPSLTSLAASAGWTLLGWLVLKPGRDLQEFQLILEKQMDRTTTTSPSGVPSV